MTFEEITRGDVVSSQWSADGKCTFLMLHNNIVYLPDFYICLANDNFYAATFLNLRLNRMCINSSGKLRPEGISCIC